LSIPIEGGGRHGDGVRRGHEGILPSRAMLVAQAGVVGHHRPPGARLHQRRHRLRFLASRRVDDAAAIEFVEQFAELPLLHGPINGAAELETEIRAVEAAHPPGRLGPAELSQDVVLHRRCGRRGERYQRRMPEPRQHVPQGEVAGRTRAPIR